MLANSVPIKAGEGKVDMDDGYLKIAYLLFLPKTVKNPSTTIKISYVYRGLEIGMWMW